MRHLGVAPGQRRVGQRVAVGCVPQPCSLARRLRRRLAQHAGVWRHAGGWPRCRGPLPRLPGLHAGWPGQGPAPRIPHAPAMASLQGRRLQYRQHSRQVHRQQRPSRQRTRQPAAWLPAWSGLPSLWLPVDMPRVTGATMWCQKQHPGGLAPWVACTNDRPWCGVPSPEAAGGRWVCCLYWVPPLPAVGSQLPTLSQSQLPASGLQVPQRLQTPVRQVAAHPHYANRATRQPLPGAT